MKYTIYQITNLIDGKTYIGCHKTNDIDDGYMGSGKYLKRAIEKHGIENFQKDILGVFDTPEEMFHMESVLVNEDFVESKDTYNLKLGGDGGWGYLNIPENVEQKRSCARKGQETFRKRYNDDVVFREQMKLHSSNNLKKAHKEGKIRYDTFTGKSHTEEAKRKIGEANSKHQKGLGNSNYGKCWIFHPELKENKSIDKTLLDEYTQQGWIKGRKIKI